jgi:FKBP-type peptidyl-prolyl cis-trans isomerase FkpA
MKNIFLIFISVFIFSCDKEVQEEKYDSVIIVPLAKQYPIDLALIDNFIDTHSINVSSDLNLNFEEVLGSNLNSIRNQTTYPLLTKLVIIDNVVHKIYYLSLRTGTQLSCTNKSKVICSYKGLTLQNNIFDNNDGFLKLNLPQTIKGWQEIIPLFKSGNYTLNSDGSVNSSTDFGAGVMFLPSALGYYNQSTSKFPEYSPLIFTFKLRHVE